MSKTTSGNSEPLENIDPPRSPLKEFEEPNITSDSVAQVVADNATRRDAILKSSLDCIVTIDSAGLIMEFNPAAEQTFGYTRDEALGQQMANLIVPPSLRAAHEQGLKHYLASGEGPVLNTRIEITAIRSNGQEFPVELAITPFHLGGRAEFTAFIRDLTEVKKSEATLRETERQLREAHKMEAVGKLAGGIAHDFNNLLTVVIGSSELLESTNDATLVNQLAADIKDSAQRAARLTRQLLTFSRKQVTELVAVDLNASVSNAEETLRRLTAAEIELKLDLEPNLRSILGDLAQIDQVVMNLVVNSGNAIEGTGQISVATRSVELGPDSMPNRDIPPGSYILLEVRDTGRGMTKEGQSRIFEPFFTTADIGEGTGLGLATLYGIVLECGGFMNVESDVGHGTTFSIYFPALDSPATPNEPELGAWNSAGGGETILVVEDENSVRSLISRILRSEGYNVLEASDGPQATSISEQMQTETIDLLVSDILMPNTDGRDLAQQLSSTRPDLKVLLISGFAENVTTENRPHDSSTRFLAKPFVPSELKALVRDILDD